MPSLGAQGNPKEEEKERLHESEGMEAPKRARPTESTKLGSFELTEMEMASTGRSLHGSGPGPLHILWLTARWFYGTINSGSGLSPTLFPVLLTVFFLLGCLVQPQYDDFYLVLLYLALFSLALISWKPALF